MARTIAPTLTNAQRRLLDCAAYFADDGEHSGVAVVGAGIRAAHRLEDLGLLRLVAWGPMEDDPVVGAERRIFAPTAKGRRLLARTDGLARRSGRVPEGRAAKGDER